MIKASVAVDLHDKLRVYHRNGVQEYRVLLALEREVRWYNWQTGEDRVIVADDDGIMRNQLFPGLWLNAERFWQGDVAGVLAALRKGLPWKNTPRSRSNWLRLPPTKSFDILSMLWHNRPHN
ncbi:MAG: Uma2 family endonuclease [Anaerolineae bacterium]|nr:Uma2 family endonuclease [Anaerolineae bacterium]